MDQFTDNYTFQLFKLDNLNEYFEFNQNSLQLQPVDPISITEEYENVQNKSDSENQLYENLNSSSNEYDLSSSNDFIILTQNQFDENSQHAFDKNIITNDTSDFFNYTDNSVPYEDDLSVENTDGSCLQLVKIEQCENEENDVCEEEDEYVTFNHSLINPATVLALEPQDSETVTDPINVDSPKEVILQIEGQTLRYNEDLEKPYVCQVCDKRFAHQSNLWKHAKSHTGERPFKCKDCDKTFAERANLMRHEILHTGERPYACDLCGMTFTQETNLNKHVLLHSGERPFACDLCDKRFTQRSNLTKHRYLHQGIRPYVCSVCLQTFAQLSNLKKHLFTHTDVRNFFCDYCKKGYIQKISMQKHMERCKYKED